MEHIIAKPPWERVQFQKGNTQELSFFNADFGQWLHNITAGEFELNILRSCIDMYEKEGSGKWEYYKKIVNPYELIFTQKKYNTFPESLCLLHPLSRSYFKMIEIFHITDFFSMFKREERLRSAHVCEGPGGFIEAFYDECSKRRLQIQQTTAMTLRPKQSNVPGWKRASSFLQKNKQIRIVYGADNTGDLLNDGNQMSFIHDCGQKVHVFTADGGFDFSVDYLSQERLIFPLLLASTRIGFEVLKEGGLFVIKFFDIYYEGMHDLLYFLSCHFRSWTLYKPATSRSCNPEQYFVGVGFKGCTPHLLTMLRSWTLLCEIGLTPRRLSYNPLPADFQTILQFNVGLSVLQQIHYLRRVFALIEHSSDDVIEKMLKEHELLSYDWCRNFNVPIYLDRVRSIEALRTCQRASGQLQ